MAGLASPGNIVSPIRPGIIPAPTPPPTNAAQNDYESQVNSFRENLPAYKNSAFAGAASSAKRDLIDKLANVKSNANSRGLLYGGLHQGAQQEQQAQASGQLARSRYDINNAFDTQSQSLGEENLGHLMDQYRGDTMSAQQKYALDQAREDNRKRNLGSLIGSGIGIGAIALSDERAKTDIEDANPDIDELLSNIEAKTYKYKNSEFGEGTYLSPMAQDLEKSKIGKDMVIDTPDGKVVDYGRAAGTILAIQSVLDKRLKKLEAR